MKSQEIKIVFFGTSDFAVLALESLLNFGYQVTAVVTQPEKPAGRARVLIPSPVKKVALGRSIVSLEPHNLKDEEFFKKFKHLNPDLCVVASYGKIIPAQYLEVPKYGFINIHPSLLPKYRGPSPIQTAIMNGDEKIGVAIMKVDKEMDHGPILRIMDYELRVTDSYKETEAELAKMGAELLIETLPQYIDGKLEPKDQNHAEATFTKILNRHDGRIDWDNTAQQIYNQIRALNPEPGSWTMWGDKILNIKMAEASDMACTGKKSGTVEKISNNQIAVVTKKCYLILKQIQLEGRNKTDAQAFLNGHPNFLSSELK